MGLQLPAMPDYETLTHAIDDLKRRGYTTDFDLKPDSINDAATDLRVHPEDFAIDEFHRFEGTTNPDDSSVIYAISSKDGVKGILIDAYGAYAENLTPDMAKKIRLRHI